MASAVTNNGRRLIRHLRVRRKVRGLPQRPRLSVFRSHAHVYAQLIDDAVGTTLASASSLEDPVRAARNGKSKSEVAKLVGRLIAQRAQKKGIAAVVFDRGGYKFHGRVKALADAAREGGLIF